MNLWPAKKKTDKQGGIIYILHLIYFFNSLQLKYYKLHVLLQHN